MRSTTRYGILSPIYDFKTECSNNKFQIFTNIQLQFLSEWWYIQVYFLWHILSLTQFVNKDEHIFSYIWVSQFLKSSNAVNLSKLVARSPRELYWSVYNHIFLKNATNAVTKYVMKKRIWLSLVRSIRVKEGQWHGLLILRCLVSPVINWQYKAIKSSRYCDWHVITAVHFFAVTESSAYTGWHQSMDVMIIVKVMGTIVVCKFKCVPQISYKTM